MRKVHRHAHEINLPPGLKLHPVFNTGSLKPYESPTQLSRPQEVILHDGRVGQIVEAVINKRHRKGTVQYLIRYAVRGYPYLRANQQRSNKLDVSKPRVSELEKWLPVDIAVRSKPTAGRNFRQEGVRAAARSGVITGAEVYSRSEQNVLERETSTRTSNILLTLIHL
ncbi:hypothetical protein F441_03930 [Phytophthora nicotianae CJ01A1]|uniref:Chromo domain-containing protein n=1 Tax=Phytophthora nicotianae CJ01A1 TaxID=1317063 RepID=W2XK35_PHYNI|nr:hypothetical protein F441_03930 [Phytophthora nicotianae CJ01A1]